jgi:hypothetical protein
MRSSSKTPFIPRSGVSFAGGGQPPTLSELKDLNDDELMVHLQNLAISFFLPEICDEQFAESKINQQEDFTCYSQKLPRERGC